MTHLEAFRGLNEREAVARQNRGEGNDVRFGTGRTYADIVRVNVFNLFNGVLVTVGALLVGVGRTNDAVWEGRWNIRPCERPGSSRSGGAISRHGYALGLVDRSGGEGCTEWSSTVASGGRCSLKG
jgi:hypothetical protein